MVTGYSDSEHGTDETTTPYRGRVHDSLVKLLSRIHTASYRLTGGMIGRRLVDNDMLLLTTTGRTTGRGHTVPLLYLRDGEAYIVVASFGGRPDHPEWYRNLVADPAAEVQVNGTTTGVRAITIGGQDRETWWRRAVEAWGDYEVYQSRTSREIPVVRLEPS